MSRKLNHLRSIWTFVDIIFILVFCFNAALLKCLANEDILHTFIESSVSGSQLRNFVYDGRDQTLYVGGVNTIYRLTRDLKVNGSISTGPQYDITECRDSSFLLLNCSRATTVSPCINQALALDVSSNTLIACGTLYHGSCSAVSLKNFVSNPTTFRPVVPSDGSKSVVLVVAPGPDNSNALFVAASPSQTNSASAAFNQRGFLAVRKLSSFELFHVDPSSSSLIDIRSSYQTNFNIFFRKAVYLAGHVYFFAVRSKTLSSPDMTSHVLRLCTNDRRLRSLVELQLECKVNGVVYPYLRDMATWKLNNQVAVDNGRLKLQGDMLFGAFTTGMAAAGDSAICAYQLSDFENAFQDAIQKCFNGQGLKGPEYIVQTEPCTNTNTVIDRSFCGDFTYNHPVYSNASFKATFGIVVAQATVTSLQIRDINSKIFGLLGTNDGGLLKVSIATNLSFVNQRIVYARVNLTNRTQPVKQIVVTNNNTVYVLSEKSVTSVRLHNCSSLTSCESCVPDPHCAWCLQSNRCTEVSACRSALIETRCPQVVDIRPHQISETDFKNTSIRITTDWIPASFVRINCSMRDLTGSFRATSVATVTDASGNKLVTCRPFATVPVFSANSIYLNLSVSLQVQDLTWAKVPLTAYSCNSLKSCRLCTQSDYLCRWCVFAHRCLPAAKTCGSDPLHSVNLTAQCPTVELINGSSSFPSHKTVNVTVIGRNMMQIHHSSSLACQFTTPRGLKQKFPASFEISDSQHVVERVNIVCPNVKLEYDGNDPKMLLTFAVLWSEHVLDSPVQMKVEVFKCEYIVSNCGQCVTLDAKYGCSWCTHRRQCSLQEDCTDGLWLSTNDTCPDPRIHFHAPSGGPLKGGTKLKVTGENLGRTVSQLDVSIGDKKCNVITEDFIPTVSFTCTTEPVQSSMASVIKVNVNNMFPVSSTNTFTYMDSAVTSWTPAKGPCSGGTIIYVSGSFLNFGSNVWVTLSGVPAHVLRRNSSTLEFVSPRQNSAVSAPIEIKIDNSSVLFHPPDIFTYVDDPVISSVHPFTAVASGGNKFEVRGQRLNSAAKPLFVVYYNNTNFTAPCNSTFTSTFMYCETPGLGEHSNGLEYPITVDYGFIMDDVMQLRKLNRLSFDLFEPFTYIEDPRVSPFDKTILHKEGMKLTIMGENLKRYEQFKDIEVLVGGIPCKIVLVESDTKITCDPPGVDAKLNLKDGVAQVTLQLGNFVKNIGFLSYYERGPPYGLIFGLIFGISIPIIIIIFVVYFLCIRQKGESPSKPTQPIVSMTAQSRAVHSRNSYVHTHAETIPLQTRSEREAASPKEDELAKDDAHYFQELLKKIENPRIRNAAKEVYISRERLEIGAMLGKGHFGCVYAATLRDAAMKNPIAVAVKTIEDSDLDQKMVENFVQEGIIMKNFNHPHVLSLLGLCLGYRKEPMVILPFMANGDLRTFVKDKSRMFTARQLLQLAQQVAEGMSYLSSLNFIHRDLAARNCMIDDKNQVKVADFGLSRELFERQYYSSKDRKAKLPVKWMALESLEDFIFTAKSDVWSFGVLMWELMTRGVTPYPDVEVSEMRTYLSSGRRLRKPKYCPDNVFGIMTDCWHNVPETRPTFTDLVNRLELLLNPPKKNKSVVREVEDEPTYINVADTEGHDYLHPVTEENNSANA